jgi:hypothetical protein
MLIERCCIQCDDAEELGTIEVKLDTSFIEKRRKQMKRRKFLVGATRADAMLS